MAAGGVDHERTGRYSFAARVLHWLMALGFLFMWACGYAMTSLVEEDSSLEETLFSLHISIGVTLLVLLVVRLFVRFLLPPPPPLSSLSNWERKGSHLGHLGLYLLSAIVILIGWAEVDVGGHGVTWFGVSMPGLFPTSDSLWGIQLESTTEALHMWLAYALLVLSLVHVAAVAKHRWIDGHDVLHRMAFSRRRPL